MKKSAESRKKLYWSLKKFSLRYNYYAFFDVREYLADRLFIQHKVRVWFDGEYEKEGSKYIAVFCHVRKKDMDKFLSALENLNRTMLICGYTDYESEVESIMAQIEKGRDFYYADENDSPIKTKQEAKKRISLIKTRYLERFVSDNKNRSLKKSL